MYEKPNYTQIPNVLIDKYMRVMKPSEFSVTMAIARKTLGWHKEKDIIAISTIAEMTGLSNNCVKSSLRSLIELGHIKRDKIMSQSEHHYLYQYSLNISDDFEKLGSKSDPVGVKKCSPWGSKNAPKNEIWGSKYDPSKEIYLNKVKEIEKKELPKTMIKKNHEVDTENNSLKRLENLMKKMIFNTEIGMGYSK